MAIVARTAVPRPAFHAHAEDMSTSTFRLAHSRFPGNLPPGMWHIVASDGYKTLCEDVDLENPVFEDIGRLDTAGPVCPNCRAAYAAIRT